MSPDSSIFIEDALYEPGSYPATIQEKWELIIITMVSTYHFTNGTKIKRRCLHAYVFKNYMQKIT